jgi:hypothetical protein
MLNIVEDDRKQKETGRKKMCIKIGEEAFQFLNTIAIEKK